MGTYDTRGGSPLHDPAADMEQPIGPLEEAVLGALEEHDTHYGAWSESRRELQALIARVVGVWIRPDAVIDLAARGGGKDRPRCLVTMSVSTGSARGATRFRVVSPVTIEVAASGDPSTSYWTCSAAPISPKTGKEMSGRPSGAATPSDYVTLRGLVFVPTMSEVTGPAAVQAERDDFIRMVAQAEQAEHLASNAQEAAAAA